jgi:fatty-acyl-CoA synthase
VASRRPDDAIVARGIKLKQAPDAGAQALPTPTTGALPLRRADFATLAEALDYAAQGDAGANFYSAGGRLAVVLPYRALREESLAFARRLLSLPIARGGRVAIIAETTPDFLRFFFACQYAGLVPVALPASANLGGHAAYVSRVRRVLEGCGASAAMASTEFVRFLREAADGLGLAFVGTPAAFEALPEGAAPPCPSGPAETAFLQYTSGSTSFPRGVVITQTAVMSNLAGVVNHGLDIGADDRCMSWLPFYHDMGLVGCMLAPMATQRSIDYLDTRDFAMRPRRWLELMTSTGATVSFSPPFGYELVARRVRAEDVARYDLRAWRVAGIGAEPIRPDVTRQFAELLAPAGFDPSAYVPCYGMAEASLAVSFAPLGQGVVVDQVDADHLADRLEARRAGPDTARVSGFVRCGAPLPGHELAIRDDLGHPLPDLHVGRIKVRGPSVMAGYFGHPEQTRQALSPDGWLDTGDIGYVVDGSVVVTGRHKDMIIINGRNIWPQDIEQIAARQPELRSMDASAFFVLGPDDEEVPVVVVQCNLSDPAERRQLTQRLHREIQQELGIACEIELVPRHTLPRTSSGKLSRAAARDDYLARREQERAAVRAAGERPAHGAWGAAAGAGS